MSEEFEAQLRGKGRGTLVAGRWVDVMYCPIHKRSVVTRGEGEPVVFALCPDCDAEGRAEMCEQTRESRPPVEGAGGRL